MEKGTPHCTLSVVKAMINAGKVRMTASAVVGAEMLGFDRPGMILKTAIETYCECLIY